jgi:hypothetical protein
MSEDNKRKDAAKALLNMGDKYTGAPSESDLEFNYDPPQPQGPVSSIFNRRESGTTNPLKQRYGPDDTYETMAAKDAIRNNGMLTEDDISALMAQAQQKGGKSRRRKSRKSRKSKKSRKNRRKTYRRKN